MVGDSIDDMTAGTPFYSDNSRSLYSCTDRYGFWLLGRRAGATTVLLVNDVNEELREHDNTDLIVTRYVELVSQ